MDEESLITIQEELSDDVFALAENHLEAVLRLIKQFEIDQLDIELQFERERHETKGVLASFC